MITIKTTKKLVSSFVLFSSLLGATVASSVTSVTTAHAETTATAKANKDTSSVKIETKQATKATQQVATVDVTSNISSGVDWIKNTLSHDSLNAWDAVALNQSGVNNAWTASDNTDLKAKIISNIEAGYSDGASLATSPQTTDYERDILGLLAAGYPVDQLSKVPSTTNDSTTDLVSLMKDGLNNNPDIYALSYGIAALTSIKMLNNSTENDDIIGGAINSLLRLQSIDADGKETGSGYWMDEYGGITDVNGMVMQVLAPYATGKYSVTGYPYTSEDVLNRLTQAAKAITSSSNGFLQTDGNIYDSNLSYGEANSSSNSMVLAGLAANDILLPDSSGSINDRIASATLKYQVTDGDNKGSFDWATDNTYSRQGSTQEAVYGLDQYKNTHTKWLFDFTSNAK